MFVTCVAHGDYHENAGSPHGCPYCSAELSQDARYPCCGALTFGDHRDNVWNGDCSAYALRQALSRPPIEA